MKAPNDRTSTNDADTHSAIGFSIDQSQKERERRIEQRRIIVQDPTIPDELRRRSYDRMCELQREADDE